MSIVTNSGAADAGLPNNTAVRDDVVLANAIAAKALADAAKVKADADLVAAKAAKALADAGTSAAAKTAAAAAVVTATAAAATAATAATAAAATAVATATAAATADNARTINGRDGDDTVNVVNAGDVTVNGGVGSDTVNGVDEGTAGYSTGAITTPTINVITTVDVETVNMNAGADNLVIGGANTSNVAVNLGTGTDIIGLADNATGTITVNGGDAAVDQVQDTLVGSAGVDTVVTTDVECIKTGAGNDSITVNNATWNSTTKIVAGAGDDTIVLHKDAIASIVGKDIVVYGHEMTTGGAGNANHSNSLNGTSLAVTSGKDSVSGFHAGAHNATVNDYIDLTGLLGDSLLAGETVDVKSFAETTGAAGYVDLSAASKANVGIIWNVKGTITTATSGNYFITPTSSGAVADSVIAKLENNGEAVIAYTNDDDGDNVASVNMIYVADTDAGTGQHWEVVDLGTVTFDRPTGLNTGTFDDNFIVGALATPTATTAVTNNFTNNSTTTAVLNYEMCLGAGNPIAAYSNNVSADI